MYKTVYLLCSFLSITLAQAETKSTTASDQKICITIDNAPVINIPMTQANNQTQTNNQAQTTSVSQAFSQTVSHYFNLTTKLITTTDFKKPFTIGTKQTKTFIKHYKTPLIAGTVLGAYAWLCYETVRGAQYLGKANLWSSWKRAIPLTTLHETPQQEITRELLMEIQKRYTQIDKPTEFMLPLIHFLHDVDTELKNLRYYDSMNSWLTKARASYVVPFDLQRFNTTRERLARLAFVKNLFLTWAADYKLEHNKSTLLTQLRGMRPEITKE
ncbi:hypothetical protein [Methylicorpusculum sp.]|uniref:hypothetical protein n=1 Tax=Methylicorpusculum sp. TaxID=2713644 RepID=UPI002AB8C33E|nr:hypothetical protein [Methylicorpusculum sp.]MDZ4150085.1 hypothetical protein [Methylicorpusculum sp.]